MQTPMFLHFAQITSKNSSSLSFLYKMMAYNCNEISNRRKIVSYTARMFKHVMLGKMHLSIYNEIKWLLKMLIAA